MTREAIQRNVLKFVSNVKKNNDLIQNSNSCFSLKRHQEVTSFTRFRQNSLFSSTVIPLPHREFDQVMALVE
jgi:ABC-type transporter lipoprotein component MlaA